DRAVLTEERYHGIRETLVYRQIGAALGMPYSDAPESARMTEGVMGLGRYTPLSANFIDGENLCKMGLLGLCASAVR
ncbi:MAG: hypothetical protein Q8P16_01835, partial [bacterium]|nr:hypothetical protein [bacterium]